MSSAPCWGVGNGISTSYMQEKEFVPRLSPLQLEALRYDPVVKAQILCRPVRHHRQQSEVCCRLAYILYVWDWQHFTLCLPAVGRTVQAIALDAELHFRMVLEPGDIQWVHNTSMMHTRDGFTDGEVGSHPLHVRGLAWRCLLGMVHSRAVASREAALSSATSQLQGITP